MVVKRLVSLVFSSFYLLSTTLIFVESFNSTVESKLVGSKLLPEIPSPQVSAKPCATKKKRKSTTSSERESQLSGYEKLKIWNYNKTLEKEISHEKKMNEKHDSISSILSP